MRRKKKDERDLEFSFQVEATISLHVEVFAKNLEEAIEKAQQAGIVSLCHQCARGDEGTWNTSGELDCDPACSNLVDVSVEGDSLGPEGLEEAKEKWG